MIASKTPAELKDFTLDWSKDLGSDAIVSSSWTLSLPGASIISASSGLTQSTVWLSGGVVGTFYDVSNTIVTAGGVTLSKTFTLEVVSANYL